MLKISHLTGQVPSQLLLGSLLRGLPGLASASSFPSSRSCRCPLLPIANPWNFPHGVLGQRELSPSRGGTWQVSTHNRKPLEHSPLQEPPGSLPTSCQLKTLCQKELHTFCIAFCFCCMIRNVNCAPACLPLHLIVSAPIQELVTSPERDQMEHPEGT